MSTVCSTGDRAFLDYGIESGTDLVTATYYRLATSGNGTFEPTPEFLGQVARAYRLAFVRRATVPIVPEPVDAAVEDAVTATAHEFLDDPDADLREDVLPAFASRVGRYTCTYLDWFPEGGLGVWFEEPGE